MGRRANFLVLVDSSGINTAMEHGKIIWMIAGTGRRSTQAGGLTHPPDPQLRSTLGHLPTSGDQKRSFLGIESSFRKTNVRNFGTRLTSMQCSKRSSTTRMVLLATSRKLSR